MMEFCVSSLFWAGHQGNSALPVFQSKGEETADPLPETHMLGKPVLETSAGATVHEVTLPT